MFLAAPSFLQQEKCSTQAAVLPVSAPHHTTHGVNGHTTTRTLSGARQVALAAGCGIASGLGAHGHSLQLYRVQAQPVVRPGTLWLRTSTQWPRNLSMLKLAISGFLMLAMCSYSGHRAARTHAGGAQHASHRAVGSHASGSRAGRRPP
jgi:hypothetical protein